ncbi:Ig-like domain-containing protein [Haloarchaeobius sp. DT45]|uniref:Ig-like domain-containing protein n=1 Tax=Haloarchaeobius sp. DT45 TaxID=3446116 RepID=UPI003F6B2BE1
MQHNNTTNRIGRWGDERGVSPVLGGILVFGLVLSLLALTQVSLVPAMNGQVEFDHNQGVQEDFEALHSSTYRVASTGAPESTSIELGTRYPSRMFLVNPAPASGSLSSDPLGVTIGNVTALDADTREYLQSLGYTLDVDTSSLVYQPRYNQYRNAPVTVYEYGVVYNRFDGSATTLVADEGFIDGNRITLVAVATDLNEQRVGSKQLTVHPVSAPAQSVAVTNTTGTTLTLTVKTTMPEARWDEILADQLVANGGTVASYTYTTGATYNTLVVRLAAGEVYTLRLAGIGIEETTSTPALDPTYLVKQNGGDRYLTVGAREQLTVQVRDAYNNPVSGVTLNAVVGSGPGSVTALSPQTDENGKATFQYDTGAGNGTASVTVWFGSDSSDDVKSTTYSITVGEKVEVDVGANINPNSAGAVVLDTANAVPPNGNSGIAELVFNNTASGVRTIAELRINFYDSDDQGGTANAAPKSFTLSSPGAHETDFTYAGAYTAVANGGLELAPGTSTVAFTFYKDTTWTNQFDVEQGDIFILSVVFDDGSTATYFVGLN